MSLQAVISPTLEQQYEELLNSYDVLVRACRNAKISPYYFRLLFSLVETYPQLLAGQRADIEVWRIRQNAGGMKESVTTNFFKDLEGIGRITYETPYDKKSGARRSMITPLPGFDLTEEYDTSTPARKRKAKQKEAAAQKQFKDPRQMLQCPECGSNHILWDATPRCENCHTVYPTVKDIPASEIVIEAELIEAADEWSFLNEETEHRQAVKPGVQIVQTPLLETPKRVLLDPLPPFPDQPCRHCGRPQRECFEQGPDGLWWSSCLPL